MTYVDTSAFLAIINSSDVNNRAADVAWNGLLDGDAYLVTSNYVMIESIVLLHARFGTAMVERYLSDMLPVVEVVWADVKNHLSAVTAMLAHPGKSGPGLVDCMSFEVIRERRITDVFTYDRHFDGRGYTIIG